MENIKKEFKNRVTLEFVANEEQSRIILCKEGVYVQGITYGKELHATGKNDFDLIASFLKSALE